MSPPAEFELPEVPQTLAQLNAIWARRYEEAFRGQLAFHERLARRALELGEPLVACDICSAALRLEKDDAPAKYALRKIYGLALARSGVLDGALIEVDKLFAAGVRDEDTLSLAARVHKDYWLASADPEGRAAHLEACRTFYSEAYAVSHGTWSGVNCATFSLIAGYRDVAQTIAREVESTCLADLEKQPRDYWLLATLGECALVQERVDSARDWYRAAAERGSDFGNLASTRRNAKLLLSGLGLPSDWLSDVMPEPTIAVFCGHMPDDENRPSPRLPQGVEEQLFARMRTWIAENGVRIGYGSAAAGSDILFHEALLEAGAQIHVVLPVSAQLFCQSSVGTGTPWEARYRRVLAQAASVTVLSDSAAGTLAYVYANWVLLGLARIGARQIDGVLRAFAVWDDAEGPAGGTASAVRDWRAAGVPVWAIHPTSNKSEFLAPLGELAVSPAAIEPGRRMVSLLFADAVGFSKLEENQVAAFVEHFLGGVAQLIDGTGISPLTRETWGDAFHLSFENVDQAGRFALSLADMVTRTQWEELGLPHDLRIRISLHAGPTTEVLDPLTHMKRFSGTHISRAARLEPVTPPNQVYASQGFAALCECMSVTSFRCDFVGTLPLAKGYGNFPVYHVRRMG